MSIKFDRDGSKSIGYKKHW